MWIISDSLIVFSPLPISSHHSLTHPLSLSPKVVADMVSLCSRVALKAWLIALYPSHAIWAYCVGHAVSSALLVVIYYGTLLWHVRSPDNCLPVKSASELGPRLVPGQVRPVNYL